jgi:hypothetical protein
MAASGHPRRMKMGLAAWPTSLLLGAGELAFE